LIKSTRQACTPKFVQIKGTSGECVKYKALPYLLKWPVGGF